MSRSLLYHTIVLLTLLSFSPIICASADTDASASYFSGLPTNEKKVYESWLSERSSFYTRHVFLPTKDPEDWGAAIFWKISNETIHFAIAVHAEGWVGLGTALVLGVAIRGHLSLKNQIAIEMHSSVTL